MLAEDGERCLKYKAGSIPVTAHFRPPTQFGSQTNVSRVTCYCAESGVMGISVAADLTAGTFAGAASLVVGHPFDTIKVKLQSQPRPAPGQRPQYNGAVDAVRKTVAEGGAQCLFRGMGAPFATVAFYNAILFAARGQMESMLAHADGSPLSVGDQAIAGLGAGTAGALIACPTELIKCRLQAQAGSKGFAMQSFAGAVPIGLASLNQSGQGLATLAQAGARSQGFSTLPLATAGTTPGAIHMGDFTGSLQYRGPMDVMRQVVRAEGGVIGLYKGLVPTLLREVPGCGAMFAAYEAIKLAAAQQQGLSSTSELGKGPLMAAGGAAGAVYWLAVYPADIIKSKLQTDSFRHPAYKGTLDCARQLYAADGAAAFFKGFSPAFSRSIPANALAFLVYELVQQAMTGD